MNTTKQEAMPEAVSSVTYTLESKNGFPLLFTVRGTSGGELLQAMTDSIEPMLLEKGYKPQVKQYGAGRPKKEVETVQGRVCPKCGSPLVYGTTKDNKRFIKCSTQKYDFTTKQRSGCDFFEYQQDNLKAGTPDSF